MRISIIGLPGSGKTTLSNLISDIFNTMRISSGDLARANGFMDSEAEKTGQLDPDESKIVTLVTEAIGESTRYILDGAPRVADKIDQWNHVQLDCVIYLMVDEVVAIERLIARGRPDDTEEIIRRRILTYYNVTEELVPHYTQLDMILRINANGTIAQTLRQAVIRLSNFGIEEVTAYVKKLKKGFDHDRGANG